MGEIVSKVDQQRQELAEEVKAGVSLEVQRQLADMQAENRKLIEQATERHANQLANALVTQRREEARERLLWLSAAGVIGGSHLYNFIRINRFFPKPAYLPLALWTAVVLRETSVGIRTDRRSSGR